MGFSRSPLTCTLFCFVSSHRELKPGFLCILLPDTWYWGSNRTLGKLAGFHLLMTCQLWYLVESWDSLKCRKNAKGDANQKLQRNVKDNMYHKTSASCSFKECSTKQTYTGDCGGKGGIPRSEFMRGLYQFGAQPVLLLPSAQRRPAGATK